MLAPRFSNCRFLLKQTLRYASTQSQQQTENAGPVVFHRLTGADRGIAVYGLNSPKDRNALNFGLLDGMREVNQLLREDTKISVVILHSLVPGIFCAGENSLLKLSYILKMYISIDIMVPTECSHSYRRQLKGALSNVG